MGRPRSFLRYGMQPLALATFMYRCNQQPQYPYPIHTIRGICEWQLQFSFHALGMDNMAEEKTFRLFNHDVVVLDCTFCEKLYSLPLNSDQRCSLFSIKKHSSHLSFTDLSLLSSSLLFSLSYPPFVKLLSVKCVGVTVFVCQEPNVLHRLQMSAALSSVLEAVDFRTASAASALPLPLPPKCSYFTSSYPTHLFGSGWQNQPLPLPLPKPW